MQPQRATAALSSPAVVAAVVSGVFQFLLSQAVWHFHLCLRYTRVPPDSLELEDFFLFLFLLILPVFPAVL